MNLYLIKYQYGGQRQAHIVAPSFASALEYFLGRYNIGSQNEIYSVNLIESTVGIAPTARKEKSDE
jgi:hypothetical protein